jgi:hypothetical protein
MLKWEAKLFRRGAGCPCCKGIPPNGKIADKRSIFDFENGDEDELDRIIAYENALNGKVPKWERPEPKILWTCAGCGVRVVRSPDDGNLEYDLPPDAKGAKWYKSHPYSMGKPEDEPAHVFGKEPVCEFCLGHCYHCGEPVCSTLEYGDVYDPGYCAPYETWHSICTACLEAQCPECGGFFEEGTEPSCTCNEDEDEDEDENEEE